MLFSGESALFALFPELFLTENSCFYRLLFNWDKLYLGNYEVVTIDTGKTTITQQKAYIGPNTIYIETKDVNDSTNNKTEIYEALHDNLGSVTDITDENGSVKQHFSYLPFGEQKQTKGVVPYHPITHKGFTGHEQIDVEGINLIHMDGRIYDPVIGRFLSADPFVQDPGNSQCLNRYSYCINNPLAFTDPTGFGLCSWVKRNIISPVVHAVKSVVNSTIGRIFTGILVAAITYFTCGLDLWVAAAIGGATTTGLGLATGNGILKSLGEGFLTATIFGGIGKIAESYKSAHDPGAINVPTPNNDKPMQQEPGDGGRAPQGDDFADPASHKSFENASPSGNAYNYLNVFPSMMSDRAPGSNYSTGTDASQELYNNDWCHYRASYERSNMHYNEERISADLTICENAKRIGIMTACVIAGGGARVTGRGIAKQVERNLVIGRSHDLSAPGALRANEYRLQWPPTGSVKSEWKTNSGLLRSEMHREVPIREASPGDNGGPYLNAERYMLKDRGWQYDSSIKYWFPSGE